MRILVIDDDEIMADFVRETLAEDGYAVDVATDGAEGRVLALANDYDAVVLDLMLPDTTGDRLAAALREKGKDVPILMLTARREEESIVRGLDAGADDYLAKPFSTAVLKARIRALLRRGGATRTETVRVGDLVLDRLSRRIFHNERRLRLTPKEYALLEWFLLRPEQVVTRTELLEKVWEMSFDPGSNVVDVHIGRLRRKLERHQVQPKLVTVRGAGYVLTLADPDAWS